MPQILLAFQDMDDSIGRPLALIAGVVAAGAARPAVFQRTRRGDALLRQHTGDLGGAVPGKAEVIDLFDYGSGFLVHDEALVLAHEVAVHGLGRRGFAAHALCPLDRLDLFARISHHPFVK